MIVRCFYRRIVDRVVCVVDCDQQNASVNGGEARDWPSEAVEVVRQLGQDGPKTFYLDRARCCIEFGIRVSIVGALALRHPALKTVEARVTFGGVTTTPTSTSATDFCVNPPQGGG